MFKPAKIREFVTAAVHKKPVEVEVNGRLVKKYETVGNARGKFKLKGTTEITANGLTVVNDKTSYTTWFNSSYEAKDILTIKGIDYEVKGTPEDTEGRGRYSVLLLERVGGGA